MQETIAIVGDGRLGRALAGALDAAGPYGRDFDGAGVDVVLLCVPDGEIAAAAAAVEIVPLVRATVENWARAGDNALTGPIARGDEGTVARHREAISERAPELLELYDALAASTRDLAAPTPDLASLVRHPAAPARHAASP